LKNIHESCRKTKDGVTIVTTHNEGHDFGYLSAILITVE